MTAATAGDVYPTRRRGLPAVIPRADPVVRGTAADGPLLQAQLSEFAARGFLVLPDCFARDDVRLWKQELERLAADPEVRRRPEAILEPQSDALRSLFDVPAFSRTFAALAADRRVTAVAEQILGSAAYVHQSRINIKPGFSGEPFAWHSDFETWHAEDGLPRMRALSCSIWLDDNLAVNGSLMLIPGSHRVFVACPDETPADHYRQSLRKQEVGVPPQPTLAALAAEHGIELATGAAGTMLVFDCNVLHASAGNLSPFPRSNVFFVYNSVANIPVAPYSGRPPRPPFVARRGPTRNTPRNGGADGAGPVTLSAPR